MSDNFNAPASYNPGPPMGPQPHPSATVTLIMGVLGLVLCGVLAPVAWILGSKAKKEVVANPSLYVEDTALKVGRILGIIGTAFLAFGLIAMTILFVALAMFADELEEDCAVVESSETGSYSRSYECGGSSNGEYSPMPDAPAPGQQL